MKIIITYNSEKQNALKVAEDASNLLKNLGAEIYVVEFIQAINDDWCLNNNYSKADAVIVIGGDGTIIKVAKVAALQSIPVLGINLGRLGYLASVDSSELGVLKRLVTGDYTVESRVMLKAEKYENNVLVDSCDCLNDIFISKNALSSLIDISVNIQNDIINYSADGLIAATPTGSTAYSLSAGGPVVDPALKCMILTPVCPHTLMTRSMVVDGSKPISISLSNPKGNQMFLSADGGCCYELTTNTIIKISISNVQAKFIKLNDVSVYKVFSEKIGKY